MAKEAKTPLKAVLVEDNDADAELVLRALKKNGFEVSATVVQDASALQKALRQDVPDVVLADYNLGQWRGSEAVQMVREQGLDIPVIIVTGALGDAKAIECIRQGATDYVLKDSLARLPEAVRRALREKRERQWRQKTERELATKERRFAEQLREQKYAIDQHAEVTTTDPQGRITYANDRFCTLTRYARAELIGQNHRILNSGFHSKQFLSADVGDDRAG
jgi:DNA-binding NtrC family response regulator